MLSMATTNDPSKSGVRDIAGALGGGIKDGSLVLIEGESKTGKSVLSQHIAYGVLRSKECSVAYYSTEYDADALIVQMDSMSLETGHDLVIDRFRVYQLGLENVLEDADKTLQLIIDHFTKLPSRFKLVIVDSPSPFITRAKPVLKMDFLHTCKQLCKRDRSIVLALDTHCLEGETLSRAHEMSDYYLKLRTPNLMLEVGKIDPRIIKVLEVTKMGGAERHGMSGIRFEIKPRTGIQILPFVQVKI
jgi:flagellar protein FlaH